MFPKTTAVILFYSDTTTSSELLALNFILLERIFKFSEWFIKKTHYLNRRDKITKETAFCGK
jgi:hypothetical protein